MHKSAGGVFCILVFVFFRMDLLRSLHREVHRSANEGVFKMRKVMELFQSEVAYKYV